MSDKEIKEEKNENEKDLNPKKFNVIKTVNYKKGLSLIKLICIILIVFIIFLICLLYIKSVKVSENKVDNNNNNNNNNKVNTSEELSLKTLDTFEKFYEIMKNSDMLSNKINNATAGPDIMENDLTTSNGKTDSYSKTNIQVENVDEADIVKTDGNYIYYLVNNNIIIVNVENSNKMKLTSNINFSNSDVNITELYVNKNKLILIGSLNTQNINEVKINSDSINLEMPTIMGYRENKTAVIIYDISEKESPKETRRIEIEGSYVSSRMIDNSVYFVSNKYLDVYEFQNVTMDELNEENFKVKYKDTKISEEDKNIDFKDIYYFNEIDSANYLTIAGFNLNNDNEVDIQTFLGAGKDIYASSTNMYLVKNSSYYQIYENSPNTSTTKIFKFNLKDGKIKFKAEAEVLGNINNQFSMDENDKGFFRIATTINELRISSQITTNSLYVLDENLNLVGSLEGLAKNEKIYSVRYMDDKAYIVTFKKVDPLFVIDLSDNNNPKVLGKLKIPGYSTYLHPYDKNHIIGFGYNTKENRGNILKAGLKMVMFDVSDLSNPKELFKVDIGDEYTSSELTDNHKALLYSKEKNIIAFPLSTYKNENIEAKANIYKIDLNKGFVLQKEILNSEKIDRIIYIKDNYYILSRSSIKAINMNTLEEVDKID